MAALPPVLAKGGDAVYQFLLGLFAVGLWLAALTALWFTIRGRPHHPSRTIRDFHALSRVLARQRRRILAQRARRPEPLAGVTGRDHGIGLAVFDHRGRRLEG